MSAPSADLAGDREVIARAEASDEIETTRRLRFRDIHTVTQQLQGRFSHFETVGAWMLGVDADLSFV
jgi:hypothetical protein